jgi:hypothetical protein
MAKPRRFTIDLAANDEYPPQRGDIILTACLAYRVLDSREVDSRQWCNRWKVTVQRIGARDDTEAINAAAEDGTRLLPTSVYRKGETPAEYFGQFDGAR